MMHRKPHILFQRLILVLVLAVSFSGNSASALFFPDVPDKIWFSPFVNDLTKKGIINSSQAFYRPSDSLNRAEMAQLIVKAFKLDGATPQKPTFTDVPKNEWFYSPIETVAKYGIVTGYIQNGKPTGNFGPADLLTREQAAKMITLAKPFALGTDCVMTFPDVSKNMWSFQFIQTVHKNSIVDGYLDGTFGPHKNINRAEAAKMISNSLNPKTRSCGTSTTPTPDDQTDNDLPPVIVDPNDLPPDTTPDNNPTDTGNISPTIDTDLDEIKDVFTIIRDQTLFPVQGESINDIEDTFAPRIHKSTISSGNPDGDYDWHRGLDIDAPLGTPVLAVMDGEFVKYEVTESGGNTVYIRHKFPNPVHYLGKELTYYYTVYLHLDTVTSSLLDADELGEHPAITQGEQIGTVGHTGADVDHLHFELRIGTYCSLEWQLKNPQSTCSKGFFYDPHMNPLYLFKPVTYDILMDTLEVPVITKDTIIRFTVPDEEPALNRFEILFISKGKLTTSYILDLNKRSGFNADTNALLDVQDTSKPYFAPVKFTDKDSEYHTDLVIPHSFVEQYPGVDEGIVTVTDIWGKTKSLELHWN